MQLASPETSSVLTQLPIIRIRPCEVMTKDESQGWRDNISRFPDLVVVLCEACRTCVLLLICELGKGKGKGNYFIRARVMWSWRRERPWPIRSSGFFKKSVFCGLTRGREGGGEGRRRPNIPTHQTPHKTSSGHTSPFTFFRFSPLLPSPPHPPSLLPRRPTTNRTHTHARHGLHRIKSSERRPARAA